MFRILFLLVVFPFISQAQNLIKLNDSIHFSHWDPILDEWIFNSKFSEFTRDVNNNTTSFKAKGLINSVWTNQTRVLWNYDSHNNKISTLTQSWNGNSWENNYLYTYTYNSNNQETFRLYQEWIDGAVRENQLQYVTS